MVYVIAIISILFIIGIMMLNHPAMGGNPKGDRLKRIQTSKQYINGKFNFPNNPIVVMEGKDTFKFIQLLFKKVEERIPSQIIQTIQPDFTDNPSEEIQFTWFGHSSYLIQIEGKNILVDPVFSQRTSPFQFMGPQAFKGTDFVGVKDLPRLDIVLITHDHYDHLDYDVIKTLKDQPITFITSLGVGAHLEKWGVSPEKIIELDWFEDAKVEGFQFTALPARHFTGRGLTNRFSTLWSSFALKTSSKNIFLGGDSGYGEHFKMIGEQYGPFDLTFMETGQYNELWYDIHSMPEDAVQAHLDLQGNIMMSVHWAKFPLAYHPWTEPIERVKQKAHETEVTYITPQLGEKVLLNQALPQKEWWK